MNRPIARADIEQFTSMALEKRRRRAKVEQSQRGYRDEDGVWQGGLLAFVRYFWAILEPGTKFRDGWALQAVCEHLEAVTYGEITKLLINVPPGFMKSLLTDVFWPAWEWGPLELHHLRYVAFSYSSSLTERDNGKFAVLITSAEYQMMYPHVEVVAAGAKKVSNTEHGWKLATSVGGVGTGERGDRIILDDPHNVKESESEVVRKETIRWFWESMSSRLNDMTTGAKVVIMQRVNEEDVSGEIILAGDWVHLLIPMEYVWGFVSDERGDVVPPRTEIGWTDPRWRETPEECDGELAWPERFPEKGIPSMKKDAGPFAWACNPYEAPILMADLSMKPIGSADVGDEIVGFKIGNDGKTGKRARYRKATILDIHKSLQPVVKITFDSGRTIRCTANHKWWTGRSGDRPAYAPAVLGSKLRRVCPPSIEPISPENMRAAGWLAGFFDGEGTVSLNQRMFTQKERVISIEPEGTEEVYGLTTTTGNYVVWGLASSNSQYQQTPEARGGGIFKREWWQPWEPGDGKFPVFTYVVVSIDSAYDEKESADPSAAVVLGIFENAQGYNRVMLMHAWRRRLQFSGAKCLPEPGEKAFHFRERLQKSWGLVEWAGDTCTRFKADRLLIEAKASGISAAQSLGNSHPHAGWSIQLVNPVGDKHARAISVQPSFSQEMVYVPYPLRTWGETTIDEMAVFPKGKFKDLTDAMTQGIKHLRDSGLLRTDEERRHETLEKLKIKPKKKPLYPGVKVA